MKSSAKLIWIVSFLTALPLLLHFFSKIIDNHLLSIPALFGFTYIIIMIGGTLMYLRSKLQFPSYSFPFKIVGLAYLIYFVIPVCYLLVSGGLKMLASHLPVLIGYWFISIFWILAAIMISILIIFIKKRIKSSN